MSCFSQGYVNKREVCFTTPSQFLITGAQLLNFPFATTKTNNLPDGKASVNWGPRKQQCKVEVFTKGSNVQQKQKTNIVKVTDILWVLLPSLSWGHMWYGRRNVNIVKI